MSRMFFTKAHLMDKPPRKSKPQHKGKKVYLLRDNGAGYISSSRHVASQLGRSKGGQTAHAKGTAHRWTSKQARKAAKRAWRTRWRMNTRIGTRIGRPAKNRPRVNHAALRVEYSSPERIRGIWYEPFVGWLTGPDIFGGRKISERTALKRLGYLKPTAGYVPKVSS